MKKIVLIIIVFMSFLIIVPNFADAANLEKIELSELEKYLTDEEDDGITIENIELVGRDTQIGLFVDAETSKSKIPGFDNIDTGIVLTSGTINQEIFVPNNSHPYPSYAYNSGEFLPGGIEGKSYDTAYLKFDVISNTDVISFRYVFASEEFDQPPQYNDKMKILFKEDGQSDTAYSDIAIQPIYTGEEGDEKREVSINKLRNTEYHYDNIHGEYFAFLGYTPLLSCKAEVEPGKKYNFIISIMDMGDPIYDSAVLIKANSVSSKDPPPSEENPNPSTRALFEAKKEVTAMRLTLSNGKVMNWAQTYEDDEENVYLTPDSFNVVMLANAKPRNMLATVDMNMLQGALLEIEYAITITNTSVENISFYTILDKKPKKNYIYYNDTTSMLTEDRMNSDYVWIQQDNGVYLKGGGIGPEESVTNKIILSKFLSNENTDCGPYKNTAIVKAKVASLDRFDFDEENMETKTVSSGEVTLIPPTGHKNVRLNSIILVEILLVVIMWVLVNVDFKFKM